MTRPNIPPHIYNRASAREMRLLEARLGVAQMADDCKRTVALAEAAGLRVRVDRLQLGDWRAPEFGTMRTIYITPEREAR